MNTSNFPAGPGTTLRLDVSFDELQQSPDIEKIILLTDDNLFALYKEKFSAYTCISIKAGESNKTQATVDRVIAEMLELNIDRSWLIIGVGGGVVTDIAGYVASIYKRGMRLALAPTTILAMTDAAIGGKNGVNVGQYKNMVGTTHRPEFILYDYGFLDSLPRGEWINGFAEIIKHACIKDAGMFAVLEQHSIDHYLNNPMAIRELIEKNIAIKNAVVLNDEFETGERYQLNFGHSFGHAIENLYGLPHGHAISIGMVIAARVSENLTGLPVADTGRISALLEKYLLPASRNIDPVRVLDALKKDKKSNSEGINFVLLQKIGEASVQRVSFEKLGQFLSQIRS